MNTSAPIVVSVITVCKDSAHVIDHCLRSVADQSYSFIEHIVVDGGSTDDTLKVIERFQGRSVRVVSEADFGIYDAMNKGLRYASGEIICFLNSDDYYRDDKVLDDVVSHFNQVKCDIVLGDIEFFDLRRPLRIVRKYSAQRFKPHRLKFGWMPPHPGFFARKRVYNEFGWFDNSYRIAGDFEFISRVFSSQDIEFSYLKRVVVKMAVGGISTAGLKSKVQLNREVMRACRMNGIKTNWLYLMMKYPVKLWDMISIKFF